MTSRLIVKSSNCPVGMFRVIQEEIGIDEGRPIETRILNSDLLTPQERTPSLSPPSVKHLGTLEGAEPRPPRTSRPRGPSIRFPLSGTGTWTPERSRSVSGEASHPSQSSLPRDAANGAGAPSGEQPIQQVPSPALDASSVASSWKTALPRQRPRGHPGSQSSTR